MTIIDAGMNLPSDPESRKAIKRAINDGCDALLKIDAERDHIKNIKRDVKDEFGISPKHLSMMIRAKYKDNIEDVVAEVTEVEAAMEILFD